MKGTRSYDQMKIFMAGMGGLEPPYDGVKVRCLATWLHPNDKWYEKRFTGEGIAPSYYPDSSRVER